MPKPDLGNEKRIRRKTGPKGPRKKKPAQLSQPISRVTPDSIDFLSDDPSTFSPRRSRTSLPENLRQQGRATSIRSDPDATTLDYISAHRSNSNAARRTALARGRDIHPIPNLRSTIIEYGGQPAHIDEGLPLGFHQGIDWERRLRCKKSVKAFCETYLPSVFFKGWSHDQLRCIEKVESVFLDGGMFSLAMPRAGGKTAICRGAILWGSAYAHRRFMYFVGSKQDKAQQTLEFVKMYWYRNPLLMQDFPEIAWSINKLENRFHLASGQTYNGESTYVDWGSDVIKFPSLVLSREDAQEYLDHDPESLRLLPESAGYGSDVYLPIQAGIQIATAGVDGSIRGEADVHPITLEQPRPDLVLLDDVQKDSKADSPTSCEKLIRLIDGAISGLSGPGEHIAALMPCTVIREGDVSDTYLDPLLKPDWNGERCKLVIQWPDGITDYEVRQDTIAGKHWNKYNELRRVSLLAHQNISLATAYYAENRAEMDGLAPQGATPFLVSWPERYTTKGKNPELSAQQHAMELRFKSPGTFSAEYQNIGRKLVDEGEILITAEQLMKKTTSYKWGELPPESEILVAFIDVQNEGFYYQVLGCDYDYNGIFTKWGVWPEVDSNYWTRAELDSWSLLSNAFFKEYPQLRAKAAFTSHGQIRAPLEAKMYFGLDKIVTKLLSMEFTRQDTFKKKMKIQKIGIDTRFGKASEAIKRYIRESRLVNTLIPCQGQSFPPTNRQLEEYENRTGWLFEHQQHPNVKEPAWVIRPHRTDGTFSLQMDASRMKDRLFARLSSPPGSAGCIMLPDLPAEALEMLCHHICSSEYPEPVQARGIIKNIWQEREGTAWNNDFLDCSTGCIALASVMGASLKTTDEEFHPQRRRLSEMYKNKAQSRRAS